MNKGEKNYLTPLSRKIKDLEEKGFTIQYKLADNSFENPKSGKTYKEDELKIIDEFRFEGESNPSDMSILYAIESNDGDKGTIVNAYGVYADEKLNDFINRIEKKDI